MEQQTSNESPAQQETLSYEEPRSPSDASSGDASSGLARGTAVQRYIVLERIGEGGMGVVYAAYDTTLDRRVALKFLAPQGGDRDRVHERRLLREGQAMARLSHPNVAVVYEVGVFQGRVFLSMEFVDGMTLRAWLAERPRSFAEILDVFRAAGRGLAAAHAASIVHRDFKPDNVLVDVHGRPRVTDFGLSRAAHDPQDEQEEQEEEPMPVADRVAALLSAASYLSSPLTRTGGLLGTPSYMAPEQRGGHAVDARSDQYSFCVALYEALYGEPPFKEDSSTQPSSKAVAEMGSPTSGRSSVPRWCRQALLRGMAAAPANRFPSMDALLAGLTRPLKRRRQVLVVASLSIMLAGSAAYALSYDRPSMNSAPTCDGGVHRLAGVWDAGRKGQVRDAFQASGARGADVTWTAFSRVLDGWATAWVAMHNQTCAETHLAGVQSPAILDLRMECLDRKRQQVQALVAVYSEKPDAGSLDRAVAAAENVSSISACADVANLRAVIPLPEDPAVRAKVNSLRQRLNRSYALSEAGRAAEGRAYTEPLKREADTLGYAPLAAEAALALARHLTNSSQADEAEKLLFDALKGAIAGRDSKLEANIWLTVLDSYIGQVRVQESLLFARIAELAVFRAGDDVRLRARLAHGTGHAEYIAERAQGAVRQFQLAVELWKKSDGAQSRGYTSALSQLGNTLAWIGRTREGIGYLEQALAIQRATLRPDHPDILFALRALRDWYRALGQFRKADELFEEWLELDSIDKGPGNRLTAFSLTELGLSDADLGNVHRAIERFTKALSIRRGQFKSPSPVLIYSYCVLGDAQRQAGLLREAEDSYNHANEEAIGAGIPPDDGFTSLGLIYNSRRRHRQALRHCRRAFEGLSKNYGEDSPLLLSTRECIADALIGTGDVAGARVILERPLAAINELDVSPQHLAGPRFQLARALWTTVADRPRARDLARSTLKSLASAEGDNRNLMLRIEAWLRSHAD